MKIGRFLPGFIKDPLTSALSAVLNYCGVDFLKDYVQRRQGIGAAGTKEITGRSFSSSTYFLGCWIRSSL